MTTPSRNSPPAQTRRPTPETEDLPMTPDAAQNIWLAGLGAFVKAQVEGSKAFESLVADGVAMQRKTQALAQQRMAEATHQFEEMAARATAAGNWNRLGGIFESRVARALSQLGAPTTAELAALEARLRALEEKLDALVANAASATGQCAADRPNIAPAKQAPARRKAATDNQRTARAKKNEPRS